MNWSTRSGLVAILVLCVVVRLGVLLAFPSVFAFDQTGETHGSDTYDVYARNLLATSVYGRTPGTPDALIPPLYSYVLAVVYAVFGRGYLQVGLFHILLDALSIVMLYQIGKHLIDEKVGLLAALLYAVYPYLIFQNLTLNDTPLFMVLLHAFVLLMILLRERAGFDRKTLALAALGGLALGLSMLNRPVVPPLAVLIGLWFLFRLNVWQTVARLVPVALVSAVVLAPWIIRNYGAFHAFVPMSTTSGANFWQGNSEYTIPYLRAGYDVQWTSPSNLTASDPDSREADAERFALAMQYLHEHPAQIPELLWTKFLVYWSIDITPRRNPVGGVLPRVDYDGNVITQTDNQGNLQLGGLPPDDPVNVYSTPLFDQVGRLVQRLYFGALFLLALLGIALTARQWRQVSLLWFVQISMTVVYVAFHPSTRYRVPTDPMLFLFSAYTLLALWAFVQRTSFEHRWRAISVRR